MPNQYVFNDNDQPLYVDMVNTFQSPDISAPPEISASKAAVLYSTNTSVSSLVVLSLISAITSIRISNAAGSGKTVYISRISGSIGGSSLLSAMSGSFTIVKGGTLTSPATLTPTNNNLGSAATSAMTVQSSTAAINGGTTLYNYQLAPGAFSQNFTGSIIVPPGTAICANVTSSSSAVGLTITSALGLLWWEQ
ncbi:MULTISPECIES: hypothetical protein [Paenibacillus]|uniref:hypothetical protein n=1 Tax=Paenibacillus TaxID=44249 RepID=UPI00096E6A0C|nr:hypothetical protein [Paenibacillus odorifer]MEC0131088.1 hypothetical protein [Paenibacillus odorifer]MEC0221431.1 hypothetical protein [Paenibacillus odorifer]OMD14310.1 hypothetical protein BJP50_21335 [Paenibacillus odorifer]OMD14668.1 hypothetical protein BJP47_22375 [Paenibacillus odorifer]OMD29515.1 hypothetical protein BJP48_17280 [Paenibacillus odorifer]